jgi:catechol 2,3-dioxygenase-like lactoylglutathione lyase family enzyme
MDATRTALAVKDIEATHRFYTETVGFDLEFHLRRYALPAGVAAENELDEFSAMLKRSFEELG